MIAASNKNQSPDQSSFKPSFSTAALDYAVPLIYQVCCLAGSFDLIDEFRDRDLCAAVADHNTQALYDRLIYDFSFQGISDEIAANCMAKHGQATWGSVRGQSRREAALPQAANLLALSRLPL